MKNNKYTNSVICYKLHSLAGMAELADAVVWGAAPVWAEGSTPFPRTNKKKELLFYQKFFFLSKVLFFWVMHPFRNMMHTSCMMQISFVKHAFYNIVSTYQHLQVASAFFVQKICVAYLFYFTYSFWYN